MHKLAIEVLEQASAMATMQARDFANLGGSDAAERADNKERARRLRAQAAELDQAIECLHGDGGLRRSDPAIECLGEGCRAGAQRSQENAQ